MYRKCLYEGKPLAYVENVWDFKNEREKEKTFDISFVDSYTFNKENMEAVVEKYSCADTEFAFRIYYGIDYIFGYIIFRSVFFYNFFVNIIFIIFFDY